MAREKGEGAKEKRFFNKGRKGGKSKGKRNQGARFEGGLNTFLSGCSTLVWRRFAAEWRPG